MTSRARPRSAHAIRLASRHRRYRPPGARSHRGHDGPLRQAVAGGGWTLAGTLFGRVAYAGALLLAAASLGTAAFGAFSLAQSTALVVTSLSALGLPVAATKLVSEARAGRTLRPEQFIGATLLLTASLGIAAMVCFAALSSLVADVLLQQPAVAEFLVIAAPLILLAPLAEVQGSLLAALERFRSVAALKAVRGAVAAFLVVLVCVTAPTIGTLLGALVVAEAVSCVVGWRLVTVARRATGYDKRSSLGEIGVAFRPLLHVAGPALLASVSLLPARWVGQVILSRQPDGLTQVGIFAVAYRWHVLALFIPSTMGSVLLPILGRLKSNALHADARDLFIRYGGFTLALAIPAALILVLFAGPIMGLQGPEYAVGASVLAVLGVAVVPSAVNNVASQMALADGRLALWVWSDIALAVILVVAALIAVPALGALGLAWAYLAAYIATCLVLLPVAIGDRGRRARP